MPAALYCRAAEITLRRTTPVRRADRLAHAELGRSLLDRICGHPIDAGECKHERDQSERAKQHRGGLRVPGIPGKDRAIRFDQRRRKTRIHRRKSATDGAGKTRIVSGCAHDDSCEPVNLRLRFVLRRKHRLAVSSPAYRPRLPQPYVSVSSRRCPSVDGSRDPRRSTCGSIASQTRR